MSLMVVCRARALQRCAGKSKVPLADQRARTCTRTFVRHSATRGIKSWHRVASLVSANISTVINRLVCTTVDCPRPSSNDALIS